MSVLGVAAASSVFGCAKLCADHDCVGGSDSDSDGIRSEKTMK